MTKLFFVKVSCGYTGEGMVRGHANYENVAISSRMSVLSQVADHIGWDLTDTSKELTIDFIIPMSSFD